MTYDTQAEARCDHRVHRELSEIDWVNDLDYRTLRIGYPLANDDVRVWFNEIELLRTDPVYGWQLVIDENSAREDPRKKIVFKRPVYSYRGIFELSYTVRSGLCRKCFGLNILYDHAIRKGQYVKVVNEQKLMQMVIKMLVTEIGSNPFFPQQGTSIATSLFQGVRDPRGYERQITSEVMLSLQRIQNIQLHQSKVQQLTLREILRDVNNVSLMQSETDPRAFRLEVTVTSAAGGAMLVRRELYLGENQDFFSSPIREAGIR